MFAEDDEGYPFYGLEDLGFLPDWMGRRKRRFNSFFPENQAVDDMIQEMTRMMESMNNPYDLPQGIPPELVRKRTLPDGTEIREFGPVVVGYSMTVDENGNPVVHQFGNARPNQSGQLKALQEKREPLIDIINEGETVKIVAELAGVKKEEINVSAEPNGTVVIETTGNRKYYKTLKVPVAIDENATSSTYNNGILTVIFKAANLSKPKSKQIKVE